MDIKSYKYLTRARVFATLFPPLGDLPNDFKKEIENFSYQNNGDEIKFIFHKPLRVNDRVGQSDLDKCFNYTVEIISIANTIQEGAHNSVFILEKVLDMISFLSQSTCRIIEFSSIVNLTQIENVINNKEGNYENGIFRKLLLNEIKSFPPGHLVFLSEQGIKTIGRNLHWFRTGLFEVSVLNKFVSFFTALKELDPYFREGNQKDALYPSSVKDFIENTLRYEQETYKKWGDIRNDILHIVGKRKDYRNISISARSNLPDLYKATYYGIAKFFTDNPLPLTPLIIHDDIEVEIIKATPEIVNQLNLIKKNRDSVEEIVLTSSKK